MTLIAKIYWAKFILCEINQTWQLLVIWEKLACCVRGRGAGGCIRIPTAGKQIPHWQDKDIESDNLISYNAIYPTISPASIERGENHFWFSKCCVFTARKRSLGQGNIFTPVCHSVHRGRGGCLSAWWDNTTHPLWPCTPQDHAPPRDHAPPGPCTPRTMHPQDHAPLEPCTTRQDHAHPREESMLGDTVNAWAVRILLECNLVKRLCLRLHIPFTKSSPWIILTAHKRSWQKVMFFHMSTYSQRESST